ncbi:TetR/AcrR family transcriptional regulator [Bailinhaonella thermotolerans]|uniref:TetR/AcrR family transcriptional regulator n=1 Tax=Bailinhaonella thermotolerans TaxID=1070861 RepID=UPI001F5BC49E|nr:TetR/AcrR family transcriptional regulator [Bailinhaonella thermotolerans]
MQEQTVGRRARLRAQTTAEIKAIALKHLSEGGPDALSLRAIGREMGMSGSAIYSYFETRDALITTLINDIYTSLLDQVETARDAVAPDDIAGRILAWGQAVRLWALANPEGFRLIYGDPVAGYHAPAGGPAPEAAKRACLGLTELAAAAWPYAKATQASTDHQWSDFSPGLADTIREHFPDLPPAAVALALRMWGRMHGLISLEVYGHLGTQTGDPAKLYHAELLDLIRSLGLGVEHARQPGMPRTST